MSTRTKTPRHGRAWLALAALSLGLYASRARAQCPSSPVAASNGATFSCGPAPTPIEASNPAPGAFCPSPQHDVRDSANNWVVATRVRDLTVSSVAVGNKPMKVRIILPRDYASTDYAATHKTWPVLYLLTGYGASYESWTCATRVLEYVKNLNVIVVMPEGTVGVARTVGSYTPDDLAGVGNAKSGVPGWYSDWLSDSVRINNGTSFGPSVRMRLSTHHNVEIRDILNRNFHANDAKYAIAGLSMGGFGTIHYNLVGAGAGRFVAAAAFSGPLDTEYLSANIPFVGGFDAPTLVRSSIELAQLAQGESMLTGNRLWGEKTSSTWRAHNPKRLVTGGTSRLAALPLYISTGQGNSRYDIDLVGRAADGSLDAAEVGAFFATASFLAALNRSDPQLTLEYFPRAGHTWTNWDVNLCRALNKTLLAPLATPSTPVGTPYPLASCPTIP
jgi:diacylglycerol O-acyltransferase / trehalose O-mycolyltransferase